MVELPDVPDDSLLTLVFNGKLRPLEVEGEALPFDGERSAAASAVLSTVFPQLGTKEQVEALVVDVLENLGPVVSERVAEELYLRLGEIDEEA